MFILQIHMGKILCDGQLLFLSNIGNYMRTCVFLCNNVRHFNKAFLSLVMDMVRNSIIADMSQAFGGGTHNLCSFILPSSPLLSSVMLT